MHNQPEPVSAPGSRRAEANRQNALRSTGPKTDVGKARSSRNSSRHNLLAKAATPLAQPNQELQTLLNRFNTEFHPSSVHEETLIQELAGAAWRMRLGTRFESGLLSIQMERAYDRILNADKPAQWNFPYADGRGEVHHPEPEEPQTPLAEAGEDVRTVAMGAALADDPAVFALVLRYQTQARRDYFRILKELQLVRTGQAAYLPDDPPSEPPKPVEPEPEPVANETKPTPAAPVTPAASAIDETKPNFTTTTPDSGSRSHNSADIVAGHNGNPDAIKVK
jgi:hypothetical protein